MEYPEFQTGIFGRMENAHYMSPFRKVVEQALLGGNKC